jgi:hypothetical protein
VHDAACAHNASYRAAAERHVTTNCIYLVSVRALTQKMMQHACLLARHDTRTKLFWVPPTVPRAVNQRLTEDDAGCQLLPNLMHLFTATQPHIRLWLLQFSLLGTT